MARHGRSTFEGVGAVVPIVVVGVALALGVACSFPQDGAPRAPAAAMGGGDPPTAGPQDALARGKELFAQNCSGCHGPEGLGDGPAAEYLYPKPRDFTKGFRFTSGRSGELPTSADLFRVITEGMPGSAMPSWELITENDRWAIVAYVKSLVRYYDEDEKKWVNFYAERGETQPVDIGAAPPSTSERVARGKMAFRKAECWKCHGQEGRGDGPSAIGILDEAGHPVLPRDFSEGVFKGGSRPEDLFRRVSFGMGPMPGHEKQLTADERWDVVHYVLSLVKPEAQRMARQVRKAVVARRTAEPIPTDPSAPFWKNREPTYLALMPLWWRKERVEGVLVRAVHDGSEIAIHVSWVDPTSNTSSVRPQEFRDGAAVQFAKSTDAPFIAMGADREKVNIWFWKADLQGGPGVYPDVASTYPHRAVDDYPGLSDWKPGEGFAAQDKPAAAHDPTSLAGWGAGNIVSDPTRKCPVENLAAGGFSTLANAGAQAQVVQGEGRWDGGVWSVVFRRKLAPQNDVDVDLAPGRRVPAAFAVWDGEHNDRNGQKSITIWHDLEVDW